MKVTVAGGCAVVAGSVIFFVGAYQDLAAFRRAPFCAGAAAPDCIASEDAAVVEKHIDNQRESGLVAQFDPPGVPTGPPDPFPHEPITSPPSEPAPEHVVTVQRGAGEPTVLRVDAALYEAATVGDRARLRLWHGDIVEIDVQGTTSSIAPPSSTQVRVLLVVAWIGAGVAVRAMSRRPGDPR
jgi:hypothetical protein